MLIMSDQGTEPQRLCLDFREQRWYNCSTRPKDFHEIKAPGILTITFTLLTADK